MLDDDFANRFVRAGIRRVYDSEWQDWNGNVRIVTEGVGILVSLINEDSVKFYAGAASGLVFSPELCATVAVINVETHWGTFYLSREQGNYLTDGSFIAARPDDASRWSLIYHMKVRRTWIEPVGVSEQIILDVLVNIPGFVQRALEHLYANERAPITEWDISSEGSWMSLIGHI